MYTYYTSLEQQFISEDDETKLNLKFQTVSYKRNECSRNLSAT